MRKSKIILKDYFIFIIPIAILLHFMTLGHWTVEYEGNGENYNIAGVRTVELEDGVKKYYSDDVRGFPFPSHGHFMPVVHPASSDWEESVSIFYIVINWLITLIFSGLLYYFIFRKFKVVTIPNVIWVFPIYLFGIIFLLPTLIWIGSPMPWFNDFKIISYHFWSF